MFPKLFGKYWKKIVKIQGDLHFWWQFEAYIENIQLLVSFESEWTSNQNLYIMKIKLFLYVLVISSDKVLSDFNFKDHAFKPITALQCNNGSPEIFSNKKNMCKKIKYLRFKTGRIKTCMDPFKNRPSIWKRAWLYTWDKLWHQWTKIYYQPK